MCQTRPWQRVARDLISVQSTYGYVLLRGCATFAFQLVTPLGIETFEEVTEIRVMLVMPVILKFDTACPSERFRDTCFVRLAVQDLQYGATFITCQCVGRIEQ